MFFLSWLAEVVRLFSRVRMVTVASWMATVAAALGTVLVGLLIGSSGADESVGAELGRQTRPITWVAALCAAPGLVALMALRSAAAEGPNWLEQGVCRLRLLLRLRAEARRLVTTLGGFLTAVVVATGMRRRALLAINVGDITPEEVLLYGLLFAGVLGLFFIAASSAIDMRAQSLIDEFAALPDPGDSDLLEKLRRRNDLAALVGSGGSWRSFETSVVIAAPLLTALIASATSS